MCVMIRWRRQMLNWKICCHFFFCFTRFIHFYAYHYCGRFNRKTCEIHTFGSGGMVLIFFTYTLDFIAFVGLEIVFFFWQLTKTFKQSPNTLWIIFKMKDRMKKKIQIHAQTLCSQFQATPIDGVPRIRFNGISVLHQFQWRWFAKISKLNNSKASSHHQHPHTTHYNYISMILTVVNNGVGKCFIQ